MAKPRSRLLDYAVYLAVRVVGCILQILPPELAFRIVCAGASLAYRVDRRHREVAIDNLRHAFPGRYSADELARLVRGVYQHFAMILLEMLLIHRKLGRQSWRRFLTPSENRDFQDFLAVFSSGRPVLIVTAHYGSWEMAAFWLSLLGVKAHLVARPLDNPYLDDWLRQFRERTGHKVLPKKRGLVRMRRVLAAGGTVCTLADQDAGARGMFVDFFGRPASTHKAIAHLAQNCGATIVVVGTPNKGGLLRYTLRLTDIIHPEDYAANADAAFAITQRVTAAVERLVRYDPGQYFWLHRRWKHQPERPAA